VPNREELSFWHATAGESLAARPPLPGDLTVDLAIVGAGYTGLWTAYYLRRQSPSLRIAVLEREVAGFGASGRNGGWCSSIFPASLRRIARDGGRDAVMRLQAVLNDAVDEVGRVAAAEGIACDFAKGGYVSVARNAAQWARARGEVETARAWGVEGLVKLLSKQEALDRLQASAVLGGTFTPHCAAIHPAKLVRGLARVVEAAGGSIYEGTMVTGIMPGRVTTNRGIVTAETVLIATEGFTPSLPGHRRDLVPMYSLMVATEPLSASTWERIGLRHRETFSDKRHLRIYGQRTSDDRIAFGGRGAPYHFGSRIEPAFDRDERVHAKLRRVLVELLPGLPRDVRFTHAWGGNLGIPRDWFPAVRLEPATRIGFAGGYVGDGVALSNLAGRALADLVLGRESELTALPFVGRRSPRWEIEPLRWIGVNAVTRLFASADRAEAASGRPARRARWFWRAIGH
jgi:glycine/D-amino acid oxidase-like deaminating enzyme